LLEQGADGVKLEGGLEQVPVVRALVAEGMEVCGHLGFTPQTLGTRGRVQGRSLAEAQALIQSACALEQAGVSLLVLELISEPISQLITRCLQVPTIGVGAGRFCDGQVLVVHDLLGVSTGERKLMKRYEHLRERSSEALLRFRVEVQQRLFPTEANAFNKLTEDEVAQLVDWVQQGMLPERER
jgi:3-methyl-2-oxobutanoate hydroxymethyltransferase